MSHSLRPVESRAHHTYIQSLSPSHQTVFHWMQSHCHPTSLLNRMTGGLFYFFKILIVSPLGFGVLVPPTSPSACKWCYVSFWCLPPPPPPLPHFNSHFLTDWMWLAEPSVPWALQSNTWEEGREMREWEWTDWWGREKGEKHTLTEMCWSSSSRRILQNGEIEKITRHFVTAWYPIQICVPNGTLK